MRHQISHLRPAIDYASWLAFYRAFALSLNKKKAGMATPERIAMPDALSAALRDQCGSLPARHWSTQSHACWELTRVSSPFAFLKATNQRSVQALLSVGQSLRLSLLVLG